MDDHCDRSDGFPHLRSSEARLSFLLRLSDALRPLDDALEIQATASRILVAELKADRVGYADVVSGSGDSRVVVKKDAASGIASLEGVYKVAEFESELCTRLRTGRIDVHADVLNDKKLSHSEKLAHRAMSIGATINVPLFDGQRLRAFFFLHYAEAHTFSAIEVEFLRETAERAWFAIEGARTKAALRESEARLTAVLESVPVGIAMRDVDGTILVANAEYRRYMPKSAISISRGGELPLWHAWDSSGTTVAADEFPRARALRGEATVPGREMLYGKDGSQQRWVSVAGVPLFDRLGRVNGQVEAISDIDALKRGAEALRESQARAQLLIDGIAVATWATAHDGLVEEDSPSWRSYTGQSFDDYKGRGWLSAVHPDDRPDIMETWAKSLQEEGVFDGEYRLRGRDGSYRWVNRRAVPLRDADGRVIKWLGINIDVDDRKRMEKALRTAERRTRALMDGIPQLMWRADQEGEWSWVSPQWTEYTGLSEEISCMMGWLAAVHPDDRAGTMSVWQAAAGQGSFEVEHRLKGRGGDYRWFLTRVVSLRDEAGVTVEWLGTATDIDDLRQAQARQSVMVTELQHRTRNIIAVVLALFEKSIESAVSVDQIEYDFGDRLTALSRVQGLLSNASAGRRVSFDELIESELTALSGSSPDFLSARISLSGPRDVFLRSIAVQTLALALHELGTNALKYGALASAHGRLAVKWWLENASDIDGACLVVEWVEIGIRQQIREGAATDGCGKELIERALPFQLKAETRYELTADGLSCTIRLPFGSVVVSEIRS